MRYWPHIPVNKMFTLFFAHARRGKIGMDAMGILKDFGGHLVHDCWAAYLKYAKATHCLCDAHIVRELNRAIEKGQKWAVGMRQLLLDLDKLVDYHGGMLPSSFRDMYHGFHKRLVDEGFAENKGRGSPPEIKGKRGRTAQTKEVNLLKRLALHEDAVLRFMTHPGIPWSNNDAGRPFRLFKVHAKVSGCFRSESYLQTFCQMRGYLESCKKNGIPVNKAIDMAMRNEVPDCVREAKAEGSAPKKAA
jgi:transposase